MRRGHLRAARREGRARRDHIGGFGGPEGEHLLVGGPEGDRHALAGEDAGHRSGERRLERLHPAFVARLADAVHEHVHAGRWDGPRCRCPSSSGRRERHPARASPTAELRAPCSSCWGTRRTRRGASPTLPSSCDRTLGDDLEKHQGASFRSSTTRYVDHPEQHVAGELADEIAQAHRGARHVRAAIAAGVSADSQVGDVVEQGLKLRAAACPQVVDDSSRLDGTSISWRRRVRRPRRKSSSAKVHRTECSSPVMTSRRASTAASGTTSA